MYSLDSILGGGAPAAQPNAGDPLAGIGFGGMGAPAAAPSLQFSPASDCDGEKFQTLWMQLPEAGRVSLSIRPGWTCNIQEIEAKMKEAGIFTMASGMVGDEIKFYFHCQLADKSGYGFSEVIFKQGLMSINGVTKTTRGDLGLQINATIEKSLRNFAA